MEMWEVYDHECGGLMRFWRVIITSNVTFQWSMQDFGRNANFGFSDSVFANEVHAEGGNKKMFLSRALPFEQLHS